MNALYDFMYTLGAISLLIAFLFLGSLLLKYLWNITMPDVFNLKKVTYWQAFRLLIIAGLLFGRPF